MIISGPPCLERNSFTAECATGNRLTQLSRRESSIVARVKTRIIEFGFVGLCERRSSTNKQERSDQSNLREDGMRRPVRYGFKPSHCRNQGTACQPRNPLRVKIGINASRQHVEAERMKVVSELVDRPESNYPHPGGASLFEIRVAVVDEQNL